MRKPLFDPIAKVRELLCNQWTLRSQNKGPIFSAPFEWVIGIAFESTRMVISLCSSKYQKWIYKIQFIAANSGRVRVIFVHIIYHLWMKNDVSDSPDELFWRHHQWSAICNRYRSMETRNDFFFCCICALPWHSKYSYWCTGYLADIWLYQIVRIVNASADGMNLQHFGKFEPFFSGNFRADCGSNYMLPWCID